MKKQTPKSPPKGLTKAGLPRKRAPGAGAPKKEKPSEKVKLTCWVMPVTKERLGDKPGIEVDRLVREGFDKGRE